MGDSIHLQWDNLNYTVKRKIFNWRRFKNDENEIKILVDANGIVKSGQLVAILGSSGSGKTTLLAAISQRIRGNVTGRISINNRQISRNEMIQRSSFVPQFDIAVDSLTVREHLFFMCELRMDRRVSRFRKNDRINDILWKLGLMKVADCRISTLSGGERKTLNLATELLTDPQIVFCDEITTGLDSYNALNVIRSLQLLANSGNKQSSPAISTYTTECDQKYLLDGVEMSIVDPGQLVSNKAIICSIHQPTSEVFECFTHVILMQSGRVCFQGTVDEAQSFFGRNGFQCPLMCNPAEFFVNVMSKNTIQSDGGKLDKKWFPSVLSDNRSNVLGENGTEFKRVRWIYQVFILLKRKLIEAKRTVKDHFIHSLTYLITAVSISLLFSGVQSTKPQSVQDINGFIFTIAAEIIFGTSYGILYYYPSTLPILRRETGENIYDLSAIYVAKLLGCLPKSFVDAYVFLLIIYFNVTFIADMWQFVQIGFTLFVTAITAIGYGLMISGVFETVRLSSELAPPIDLFMILICGFYIKLKLLRFLQYGSLFFYSIEALSIQIWN
ncbi:protein brown, partial [Bradysia coprophila]|uniref:protein brown n=1 Tax=Bradysia coprophila TaxID=38358 RepID=UPI00187DCD4A